MEVLVEGTHEESDLLLSGRARFQAPEVDGVVIINDFSNGELDMDLSTLSGKIAQVEITGTAGYDLVGTLYIDTP